MSGMQSRVMPACALALGLGLASTVAAQDAAAKGASLLAEARQAIGGADKVAAIKRLEVKGVSRRSAGNTNIEGDLEIFLELPDKFRRNESISFGGAGAGIDRVEVLNGADSWEQTSGGGGRGGRFFGDGGGGGREGVGGARPQISEADLERLRQNQLQNRRADFGRLLLAFLLTTDSPVTWIGTAQSPDGTADVLETSPGGTAVRLLLDSASHMPLMMTWQGGAPQRGGFGRRGGRGAGRGGDTPAGGDQGAGRGGDPAGAAPANGGAPQAEGAAQQARRGGGPGGFQPATFEMHLSEYKAVNGVKLPHLITRGISGQTSEELEIKSYKVNSNFKANTFSK
jgi:outer membrane lipoprotein-sorting protein